MRNCCAKPQATAGRASRAASRWRWADAVVELVDGHARLQGPREVEFAGRVLRYEHVSFPRASPARDALPALDLDMTSNEVLNLRDVPGTLLVIGGYIAVEFASILAGMGAQITLAFRDALPFREFDHDLCTRLAQSLAARGIALANSATL